MLRRSKTEPSHIFQSHKPISLWSKQAINWSINGICGCGHAAQSSYMASVAAMSDAVHTPYELEGADHRYQHRSEGTVPLLHASSGNGGALGVTGKAGGAWKIHSSVQLPNSFRSCFVWYGYSSRWPTNLPLLLQAMRQSYQNNLDMSFYHNIH